MKPKGTHSYFRVEFIATFFLVLSVIVLASAVVGRHRGLALFCLLAGFAVSWRNRNKRNSAFTETIIGIASIATLLWALCEVFHSSFAFRDVVALCLGAGITVSIVFSFCVHDASFLRCVQALSVPLFMCFPVITQAYLTMHVVFAGIYFLSWMVIIKSKFYAAVVPAEGRKKLHYAAFLFSAGFFLAALVISWALFSHSTLGAIKNTGLFQYDGSGFGFDQDALENEYFALEEKVQREIGSLVFSEQYSEDKGQLIYLLSKLLKESPEVIETKNAECGLDSYLKIPGPGTQKADTKPDTFSLKSYVDKKIQLLLKRKSEAIAQTLKKNMFAAGGWFSIVNKTNKIKYGESKEQIAQYEKGLHEAIDHASPDPVTAAELHTLASQVRQWKEFELDHKNDDCCDDIVLAESERPQPANQEPQPTADTPSPITSYKKKLIAITLTPDETVIPLGKAGQLIAAGIYNDNSQEELTPFAEWFVADTQIATIAKGTITSRAMGETTASAKLGEITSNAAVLRVNEPELMAIVVSPAETQLTIEEKSTFNAEGRYSDNSRKDISALVSWQASKPNLLTITKGKIRPLKTGTTQLYAQHLGIQSAPASISIVLPAGWLIKRIVLYTLLLALGLAAFMAALRLIIDNKTKRLKNLLMQNPRAFIINLHTNAQKVIGIFGPARAKTNPALNYALSVQERYRLRNNLFLNFTKQYLEAQFSAHTLQQLDATLALQHYNEVIQTIIDDYEKIPLLLRYLKILMARLPLMIE